MTPHRDAAGEPLIRATPAVVATDLDGTLLRSDGTLSSRTRAALRAAEAAGIDVVFVTARPLRWLPELANAVSSHGTIICLGGACILDATTMLPTAFHGFDPTIFGALLADIRREVAGAILGVERASGGVFDPSYPKDGDEGPIQRVLVETTLSDGEPAGKLLVRRGHATTSVADTTRLLDEVEAVLAGRATLADAGSPGLAEIIPLGVSKASALAQWCQDRGVDRNAVWAFGDMPNDLPMLTWAGRSFAMANAHAQVKAATSDMTASNDDEGVARIIEEVTRQLRRQ